MAFNLSNLALPKGQKAPNQASATVSDVLYVQDCISMAPVARLCLKRLHDYLGVYMNDVLDACGGIVPDSVMRHRLSTMHGYATTALGALQLISKCGCVFIDDTMRINGRGAFKFLKLSVENPAFVTCTYFDYLSMPLTATNSKTGLAKTLPSLGDVLAEIDALLAECKSP